MIRRSVALLLALMCLAVGSAQALGMDTVTRVGLASPADGPDALAGVEVDFEEKVQQDSNVLIPKLTGHPDEAIEAAINADFAAKLSLEEALLTLERVEKWGTSQDDNSGIHMKAQVMRAGNLLSMVVSTRGELGGGEKGHRYTTFNIDLLTGQPIALGDLFANPDGAFKIMEDMVAREVEAQGLNAYLEHAEVLPMPRDSFTLDAYGLTVYYPADQYALVSGTSGAFRFLYYELEPYLKESPLCDRLLTLRQEAQVPAEQILGVIQNGALPGIEAKLGEPIKTYLEAYTKLAEPDFTLTDQLYQFESPLMQRVWLGIGAEETDEAQAPLRTIRTTHIDLYGLRPGVSTLADVEAKLGEPDWTTELDEEGGLDMLMAPGTSYWYSSGDNSLEFHAREDGVLECISLSVAA